jgi:hypothetical protein
MIISPEYLGGLNLHSPNFSTCDCGTDRLKGWLHGQAQLRIELSCCVCTAQLHDQPEACFSYNPQSNSAQTWHLHPAV